MLDGAYRLLLIDHDPCHAQALGERISRLESHWKLEITSSLATGIDLLLERGFDLVLLDMLLPESPGLAALRRVRSARAELPVVVLGSPDDEELLAEAVRAGAQDYLSKSSMDGPVLTRAIHYAVERKNAEEALRTSETLTRALLDAVPDTILRIDRAGQCLALSKVNGARGVARSGHLADMLPKEIAEKYGEHVAAALGSGESTHFEYQNHEAGELRHYEARFVSSGPDEVLAVTRNVTRAKHLEEQLHVSQRLEAVGRLAGGIAHDFNNILTVISGNAELGLMAATDDGDDRQALEEIREASERAANLTRQLLAFSRKQILKPVPLDLNAAVAGTEKMLRRLIGEDVELVTELKSEFSTVLVDPAQVEQILLNLAVNARDAMPSGGKLIFETADVDIYDTFVGQEVHIASGSYAVVAVSDTGAGMDPSTKARAFDPFFTTKERGKGTGLGLSTVYGIVKQSGGYIWIYSELGVGTTIKIYLPSLDAPPAPAAASDELETIEGSGETILLVEDDPKVLEVARRFLDEAGYRVISVSDIGRALESVECGITPLHLLATDVILPGMNGRDLSEQLRSLRPGLKTLYISGYTDDAIARHGILEDGVAFLEKPYSRRGLLAAVRRVLDEVD